MPLLRAAAARAFLSVLISDHADRFCAARILSVISVQQVSGLERKFAPELDDGDAAVDGVNVHHTHGAGDGRDLVHQVFIGIDDHDRRDGPARP